MTPLKKLLMTDLEYNIWANQLLLSNATQLTPEERSRNLGASHASLVRTLRHMYDAERFWIRSLVTDSIPSVAEIEAAGSADQSRPDPPLDFLKDEWPEVWDETRRWIGPLDDNELAKELNCRMRIGIDLPVPRWRVLRHMAITPAFIADRSSPCFALSANGRPILICSPTIRWNRCPNSASEELHLKDFRF